MFLNNVSTKKQLEHKSYRNMGCDCRVNQHFTKKIHIPELGQTFSTLKKWQQAL